MTEDKIMGIIRVTSRMLVDRTLTDLAYQTRRILALQEQLSSGQRVNRPSDDPLNARRAISAKSMIAQNEQYIKNITTIRPYLTETETTVTTTLDIVQRARELAIQGRNTTNAQLQRDQIATEVNQLIEALMNEANHQTNGRYIFGGTVTISAPFQATRNANGEITSVVYNGNDNYISMEIMEGTQVIINHTGREVFLATGPQSTDIFQTLISLRDDLRSANFTGIEQRIQEANYAISQLSLALAKVGAVSKRLDTTEENLRNANIEFQRVISESIDADLAEVVVNLDTQTNSYQAALNAASRVIQPSLLDYLR